MNKYTKLTVLGEITIFESDKIIRQISYGRCEDQDHQEILSPEIANAFGQLDDYLAGNRKEFDLNLFQEGSDFEVAVWKGLMNIKYGQIITYKKLAEQIGYPKAFRAVGSALKKNRLPIVVPCHRVIAKDLKKGGYAGGIELKHALLGLELKHS